MFSLFKRKDSNDPVPQWASFFTHKEYAKFISELNFYFRQFSVDVEIGEGIITTDEETFGYGKMGLTNVAQACKQESLGQYGTIISGHFNAMIQAHQFDKEFKKIEDTFEKVKPFIGVRLYDHDYVDTIGKENVIGFDIAGDLFAMIVYDFPNSVMSIKPEKLAKWSVSEEELFELGKKNIRDNYPIEYKKERVGEIDFWVAFADHFFAPNLALDLANHPQLVGSKGALVGLPHRHIALFYPIENLQVIMAINGLTPIIYGMNQEGPGSVSNQLFWYKDGTFTQLPYTIEENTVQFNPPESFIDLLNELGE
jgi:hypothetical protein